MKLFQLHFLSGLLLLSLLNCCEDPEEPRKGVSSAVFNPDLTYGTMKDTDGNEYKTIDIGTQTWMAENLRTTHYSNGETIPNVTGAGDIYMWGNLTEGAWCSYENTRDVDFIATYGLMYNWYAVDDERGLCPTGWHVPTDEDWSTLVAHVDAGDGTTDENGNNTVAGGRLKETGTLHWDWPNRFADNSSGFTAIPGGNRFTSWDKEFSYVGYTCYMWSSSLWEGIVPLYRGINTDFATIGRQSTGPNIGMSVRCVKD